MNLGGQAVEPAHTPADCSANGKESKASATASITRPKAQVSKRGGGGETGRQRSRERQRGDCGYGSKTCFNEKGGCCADLACLNTYNASSLATKLAPVRCGACTIARLSRPI